MEINTEPATWAIERERHIVNKKVGTYTVSVEVDGFGKFIRVAGVKNTPYTYDIEDYGKFYR